MLTIGSNFIAEGGIMNKGGKFLVTKVMVAVKMWTCGMHNTNLKQKDRGFIGK